MDRFAAMQAFAGVVEAGSFVRAAERLQLSTTGISRLVGDLESHLGARLLQRTTRRITLTDAGRVYYEHCVELLADLAEAEGAVNRDTQAASGLLRINAPVSLAMRHLAALLPVYRHQQPDVSVDLSVNDRVVDLVEEGYDLAIRVSRQLRGGSLVARALVPVRLVVCAAPAYLERHGTPQTPEDLARHQCLLYSYTDRSGQWEFVGEDGAYLVNVGGFLRSNNGEVLREAAAAGEGIVLQPSFLVDADLRSGRLQPILCEHGLPTLTAYAVYPSRRYLSAKVRTFVDFLANAWKVAPWDDWQLPPDVHAAASMGKAR